MLHSSTICPLETLRSVKLTCNPTLTFKVQFSWSPWPDDHTFEFQPLFLHITSSCQTSCKWKTKKFSSRSTGLLLRSISSAKFLATDFTTLSTSLVHHSNIKALISSLVFQLFMIITILTRLTRIRYFTMKVFVGFMRVFFSKLGVLWSDFPFPLLFVTLKPSFTPNLSLSSALANFVLLGCQIHLAGFHLFELYRYL